MTIPYVKSWLSTAQRHPLRIGATLGIGFLVWVGWLAYVHVISPAPTEADIAQQTVRFNEAAFTKITTLSAKYHTSFELPSPFGNPF